MPHPLLDPVELNLRNLSHFELASKVIGIAEAFAVHPGFQVPFPSAIPDPAELKDNGNHHNAISIAAIATRWRSGMPTVSRLRLM
jgi:hypothetical protein